VEQKLLVNKSLNLVRQLQSTDHQAKVKQHCTN